MNVKFYRFIAKGNDKKGGGEQGTDSVHSMFSLPQR